MSTIKVKRLIEHLPTTPIDGLVYGLSEIKGTALPHKSTGLLTAPVSEEPCIYYYHAIKEKDDDDDWHTIHEESRCVPFRCRDDSGSILVDLQRAEFHTDTTTVRSSGSRKHIERRIEPGDSLYVLGPATIDTDTHNRLLITDTETDTEDDFSSIVSNWSEKKLMFHKAFNAFIRLAVGVVATVGIGLAIAGMVTSFGPALYVTTTGFALTYMMIGLGIMYYNDLVFLERRVDRNWSNIDVALAKRFDLITQLVEVVQGYLDHEAEVMDTISEARTLHEEDTPADPSDARLNAEERVRDVVTATIEDTPALHGHNAAAELMNTLDEVETEVALMRDGYNAIVEHYNARCRRLPEGLIARLVGFSPASYYTAEPNSSSAPDVG